MNREFERVSGTATVLEAARLMRDRSVGILVVLGPLPDHPTGVVTDRDLAIRVCAEGLDPNRTLVDQVATVGLVSSSEQEDLEDAEARMGEAQKSRLVITDTTGQIVGVLSLTDILRGDRAGRAVKTANAVLARETTPHAPLSSIHITPSTPEEEDAAARHADPLVLGGHRGSSMKEFPG
jgi:CBS domain-containing protein